MHDLSSQEKVWILCGIFVAILACWMWWGSYQYSSREYDAAIVRCQEHETPAICAAGVEERHDDCFDLNQIGGRMTRSSLDTRWYDVCVVEGVEAMREQRKKWRDGRRYR